MKTVERECGKEDYMNSKDAPRANPRQRKAEMRYEPELPGRWRRNKTGLAKERALWDSRTEETVFIPTGAVWHCQALNWRHRVEYNHHGNIVATISNRTDDGASGLNWSERLMPVPAVALSTVALKLGLRYLMWGDQLIIRYGDQCLGVCIVPPEDEDSPDLIFLTDGIRTVMANMLTGEELQIPSIWADSDRESASYEERAKKAYAFFRLCPEWAQKEPQEEDKTDE